LNVKPIASAGGGNTSKLMERFEKSDGNKSDFGWAFIIHYLNLLLRIFDSNQYSQMTASK
jgi:hypothetical protein